MGFLAGKRALILGVASNRSIAWGTAQAMRREGAELAFTYQGDKLQGRVEKMAEECGSQLTFPCDVASDDDINAVVEGCAKAWNNEIDIIVHSVAFAPREELAGNYVDSVTRAGFALSQDISSYSYVAFAKAARPYMKARHSALVTLSYLGAVRALPNYNVMGPAKASLEANVRYMAYDLGQDNIRVNAISAGPIKTLAAAGIGDFRKMLDMNAKGAALRRNVTIDEVGNAAAFLCSDLAGGITGEILYVDGGYNVCGASLPE